MSSPGGKDKGITLLTLGRTAYFSFGGLLMALKGSFRHLANVVVGENVYLLMRK